MSTAATRRPWTAEDEAVLRALHGTLPAVDIATRMGRSVPAVNQRAHRLDLTTPMVKHTAAGIDALPIKEQECTRCKELWPAERPFFDADRRGGKLRTWCRACALESDRERRQSPTARAEQAAAQAATAARSKSPLWVAPLLSHHASQAGAWQ